MEGHELYNEYCAQAAELSSDTRKGELLPAWAFIPQDIQEMWERLAEQLAWIDE